MPWDEITDTILECVRPPAERWPSVLDQVHGREQYPGLVGAAVALLKCRELLELGSEARWRNYNSPHIYYDIRDGALDRNGSLTFDHNNNVVNWFCGFFLNRCYHNIAATIDSCINLWLALECDLSIYESSTDDNWVSIGHCTRLCFLKAFLSRRIPVETKAPLVIDALDSAFRKYIDTEGTRRKINDWRNEWKESGALSKTLLQLSGEFKIDPAEGVAIACARTNAFKHRSASDYRDTEPDRYSLHQIEFCIASAGLRGLADFWWTLVRCRTEVTRENK